MKKKLKFLFLSLLLLLVLFIAYLVVPFPIIHSGVRYEVIDLGTLPKRNGSMASDINNLGQVVGNSDGQAFFWDPRERMTEILDQAWDLQINDSGVVVGRVNVTSATGWTANKMFIWSATSGTAVF
ncbi:MAG: hypothetical protein KC964_31010, partial [Candidatus Omnitrophica bacterium]|nr:hypothetical protein [Candidatus Omnitrophota bacterium]